MDSSTHTHVTQNTTGDAPLSQRLWGIDWSAHLPLVIRGLSVEVGSYASAAPFVAEHYPTIFEESQQPSPFSTSRLSDAKARYYALAADFFEFRCEGRVVGLLVCVPLDWSSYYVRSAALLPEYQGRQPIQHLFTRVLFSVLHAAGVERVELDVAPSNLAMVHVVTRLRFNATGTLLSERWGAHIHFTKFLGRESEHVFVSQFCSGPKYQLREPEISAAE